MSSIDQQFVEFVVKSLVSNPDAVSVERRIDEKGVLLELTVDPEDLGRVIGKRGATAQSLRTLLRALGTKNDARYNLKIIDNGEAPEHRPRQYEDRKETKPRQENAEKPEQETPAEEIAQEESEDSSSEASAQEDHNSVVSKTRKELEELDDLEL